MVQFYFTLFVGVIISVNVVRSVLLILFVFLSNLMICQELNWHREINGNTNDVVDRIVPDGQGNYFVTGTYGKVTDLDPGPGTYIKSCWFLPSIFEFNDAFIAKYDSAFNIKFIYTFGGTHEDNFVDFEFDSQGNILAVATFKDSADLDPGPGKNMIYSIQLHGIVVMKFDPNGQLLWHFELGSRGGASSGGIAVDAADNIYVIGNYLDSIDLDPGTNKVMQYSVNSRDIFLAKYDQNGNYLHHINLGGMLHEHGASIEYSDSNFIYIFGAYRDTIDFDPGPGQYKLGSVHWQDMYLAKYDTSFNLVWAKSIGGLDDEQPYEMVLDESDNIYITGNYRGSLDLDPGIGVASFTVNGLFDIFYAKYNASGTYQWGGSFGGIDYDAGYSIDASDTSYVYISGYYSTSMDADPGPAVNIITPVGGLYNAFLTQLRSDGSYVRTVQYGTSLPGENIRDAIGIDGHRVLLCGSYSNNTDIDPSDDTVLITSQGNYDGLMAEFFMCEPEIKYDSITICQGSIYTFPDGDTSSVSVVDTSVFGNRFECDSTIITNLKVDSFYLITQSAEICFGDTYIFPDSSTAAQSVTDTSIFVSVQGCDSLIITKLQVTQLDTSVQVLGNSLVSNEVQGNFQWLTCDSDFVEIPGANNALFVPAINGRYAVALTFKGCSDTSRCYEIRYVGQHQFSQQTAFRVYPNPNDGNLIVECGLASLGKEFVITDLTGRVRLTFRLNSRTSSIDLSSITPGTYFVQSEDQLTKPIMLIRR